MGSADFIEDAMDSLQSDPNVHYILLAARPGTDIVHRASRITTREQLEWFRRATDRVFEKLAAELPGELK